MGENGKLVEDEGTYEGALEGGVPSGNGTVHLICGIHYSGEFKDGRRHGSGEQTIGAPATNIGATYKGQFRSNYMHGAGALEWDGGITYSGDFIADQISGSGKHVV
mmetsp:Transcript_4605/g.16207  ORF Transcript_4605/g.16207 Transcript_4605/m.16207 type:complete len:106 (+) Transcript_4605:109-426(+)